MPYKNSSYPHPHNTTTHTINRKHNAHHKKCVQKGNIVAPMFCPLLNLQPQWNPDHRCKQRSSSPLFTTYYRQYSGHDFCPSLYSRAHKLAAWWGAVNPVVARGFKVLQHVQVSFYLWLLNSGHTNNSGTDTAICTVPALRIWVRDCRHTVYVL